MPAATRPLARSDALSDEALEWIVRLNAGDPDRSLHAAWSLWRAQSAEHGAAAVEAEAIWHGLGGAIETWTGQKRARVTRRAALSLGMAGFACWGAVYSGMVGRHLLAEHQTATGERRSLRLGDGTDVVLNARTALSEYHAPQPRGAELYRGQALLTIADRGAESFRIDVGGLKVTAERAVLDIDWRPGGITVTNALGRAHLHLPEGIREIGADLRISLTNDLGVSEVQSVDASSESAWQRGKLIFNQRRLGDLASELERYRQGRVVIMGESLADRRLTGIFDLSDTDVILDSLGDILPVTVNRLPLLTIIREI